MHGSGQVTGCVCKVWLCRVECIKGVGGESAKDRIASEASVHGIVKQGRGGWVRGNVRCVCVCVCVCVSLPAYLIARVRDHLSVFVCVCLCVCVFVCQCFFRLLSLSCLLVSSSVRMFACEDVSVQTHTHTHTHTHTPKQTKVHYGNQFIILPVTLFARLFMCTSLFK